MSYRVRNPELHQEEDVLPKWQVLLALSVTLGISAVLVVWAVSATRALTALIESQRPAGALDGERGEATGGHARGTPPAPRRIPRAYSPYERPMTSSMISSVPAPMRFRRMSRQTRSTPYSFM